MSSRNRDRRKGRRAQRGSPRRARAAPPDAPVIEVRIDALASGGDGVGRDPEGRVIFVPFTAPGDRVRVRVVEAHTRHAVGSVEELLDSGPARVDPVCAVFGSCGGCAWQHVAYAEQLAAKAAIVRDAFERIGGISHAAPLEVMPSPEPYGYRSRARVLSDGRRVGFRRRRSHALCATSRCPVLAPALQAQLAELAQDPPRVPGEWELAIGEDAPRRVPLPARGGSPIRIRVDGDAYSVSPGVFVQGNALLLGPIVRAVVSAAGTGSLALDLFAGAGFLTVGLARRFDHVVAVESNPAAVRDLRANLERAGCPEVESIHERVEDALAGSRLRELRPETVVLDPPRTGLPPDTADAIADLAPRRVVYLSCDPATQARDARILDARGYALASLAAFDLFPQTPHVESLAVFEIWDQGSTSPWRTA